MLNVTKVHVVSTTGANKRPHGGEVTFSDGKSYDFMWHHKDGYWLFFTSYQSEGGDWVRKSFRSPQRDAALAKHFDQ